MNISQILAAFAAYLSGRGSFRFGARTITITVSATTVAKFTFAVALDAIKHAVLLDAAVGTIYPVSITSGSTMVTIS